ncbi:hypothetical protein BB560_005688, partial [Smittium megazygosporum]
ELKGNIRVFCRARPVDEESEETCLKFGNTLEDNNKISLSQEKENAMGNTISKSFDFSFDKVFGLLSTQEDVYHEVSQLVQSALDGYSVCIFAYGQTGSGKTYTMEGPDCPSENDLGIIPRALEQIYAETVRLSSKGWKYELNAQFVEIYNEQLYDMLQGVAVGKQNPDIQNNASSDASSKSVKSNAKSRSTKVEIKQGSDGLAYVSGCTKVPVESADCVSKLLQKAQENRRVAATQCNERSSRSHCVFTLFITGHNSATTETVSSALNLIDLAGSERLSQSQSTGDRLKETQAINKSLSSLGDVIFSISNGDKHIPYRNSKLTHLLMPALGAGNSKTLMFVCINPNNKNSQETLCSLRFAAKVNSCHIGTAIKQG